MMNCSADECAWDEPRTGLGYLIKLHRRAMATCPLRNSLWTAERMAEVDWEYRNAPILGELKWFDWYVKQDTAQ